MSNQNSIVFAPLGELKVYAFSVASCLVAKLFSFEHYNIVPDILVQKGTLNIGDHIVAGAHYAKIRAMFNEYNKQVKFAGPSGLDIGGSLPESIALSILSECHACLFKKNAQSISQIL